MRPETMKVGQWCTPTVRGSRHRGPFHSLNESKRSDHMMSAWALQIHGALRRISRVQVRAIAAPRGFAQGYVARESPWLYSAANFLRRKRKGNQGEKGPGKLLLKLLLLRLDLRAFLLNPSSCSCSSALLFCSACVFI